jgi:4-hydroxy-tetrahydrodipicolinate reductase
MATRICIAGVAGRMGRRVLALAREDPEIEVRAALERPGHAWVGQPLERLVPGGPAGVDARGSSGAAGVSPAVVASALPAAGVQVVIDFTLAESSVQLAEQASRLGVALVVGTTGFDESQKARLKECAARVPMVLAPNFSVGVNVLLKAAAVVAQALGPEYEVEIVEAHHDQKVDAPSGTALALAERIAKALGRDLKQEAVYGRRGTVGKRPRGEIGIHALRMGDVVGEHTAYFAIGGERLELTHRAASRDTFARGALRAAKWLIGQRKPAGLYAMAQVLGLE